MKQLLRRSPTCKLFCNFLQCIVERDDNSTESNYKLCSNNTNKE